MCTAITLNAASSAIFCSANVEFLNMPPSGPERARNAAENALSQLSWAQQHQIKP